MFARLAARTRLFALTIAGLALVAVPSQADLIRLKNGGDIRGEIDRGRYSVDSPTLFVETLTGATVEVSRDQIEFFTWRKPIVEEYETRLRRIDDRVESHWELADWCQANGLRDQRLYHLRQVVSIDGEHEEAHRALQHVKYKGEWMTRDAMMAAKGYVRHRNRYITRQELELIEKTQAERAAEQEWHVRIRKWSNWLSSRDSDRRKAGRVELQRINDPDAVPALTRFLKENKDAELRMLCVAILSQMPGGKPVPALVDRSLHDADYQIRYQAANGIKESQFAVARPYYLRALSDKNNKVVNRAGSALKRVGDDTAVPALIDALVTSHKYTVRVPVKGQTMSFNSQGSFGPGAGQLVLPPEIERLLRTGQLPYGVQVRQGGLPNQHVRMKNMLVRWEHQNAEVYAALQKLTGQDFGYDERSWRLWYASQEGEPQLFFN